MYICMYMMFMYIYIYTNIYILTRSGMCKSNSYAL